MSFASIFMERVRFNYIFRKKKETNFNCKIILFTRETGAIGRPRDIHFQRRRVQSSNNAGESLRRRIAKSASSWQKLAQNCSLTPSVSRYLNYGSCRNLQMQKILIIKKIQINFIHLIFNNKQIDQPLMCSSLCHLLLIIEIGSGISYFLP